MTIDYRALCDELKDAYAWCLEECMRVPAEEDTLIQRARAALAQPEPEVPTDEDLDAFIYGFFFEDDWYYNTEMERGLARAALARYGGSTSNPTEA